MTVMNKETHPDHAPPTANRVKRRRAVRARLKRANHRLRDRLGRYHRLFLTSTGVALILAFALGFVTLSEPEPDAVLLGTGRAGLKPAALAVDTTATADTTAAPRRAAAANTMPDTAPEAASAPAGEAIGGGEASYYGPELAGRPTASGETFNPARMTAAHRTLPFGSRVRVTNQRTGRSVVVRINDRGPFAKNRVIDLSLAAAREIGLARAGVAPVRLELLN